MEIKNLDAKIEEIKVLYYEEKLSSIKIGKIYGVSHTAILDCMDRNGFARRDKDERNRKYLFNQNYFDKIDTKDKAYFLGLLFADGSMEISKGHFAIKLQEEDGYILELFNSYMASNKPIYQISKPRDGCSNMKLLSFCSRNASAKLHSLGMIDNKSLIVEFPKLDINLVPHFIRGYYDGDGGISIPNNRPCLAHIDFCVSLPFGIELKRILNELGLNPSLFIQENQNIYHLALGGRYKCLKVLDWLYKDKGDLFLKRKFDKYLICKTWNKNTNRKCSSKYIGVRLNKKTGKFGAGIFHKRKYIHIGVFKDEKDAAHAYNNKIIELGIDKELNIIN